MRMVLKIGKVTCNLKRLPKSPEETTNQALLDGKAWCVSSGTCLSHPHQNLQNQTWVQHMEKPNEGMD